MRRLVKCLVLILYLQDQQKFSAKFEIVSSCLEENMSWIFKQLFINKDHLRIKKYKMIFKEYWFVMVIYI